MRVLIIDDSRIVRARLAGMLRERAPGLELITEAEGPEEARAHLAALRPDVVILDIRLPGGGGLELLQGIKQAPRAPVVVVLTNAALPQYRKAAARAGADYFFDKSSEMEQVAEALRRLSGARVR